MPTVPVKITVPYGVFGAQVSSAFDSERGVFTRRIVCSPPSKLYYEIFVIRIAFREIQPRISNARDFWVFTVKILQRAIRVCVGRDIFTAREKKAISLWEICINEVTVWYFFFFSGFDLRVRTYEIEPVNVRFGKRCARFVERKYARRI